MPQSSSFTLTPINMGEAIIEPFWDTQLSGLAHWQVTPGEAHGLRVSQNWCWVTFEWARRPATGSALSMTRECDLDCTGYDELLVSVMAPEGAVLRVELLTERGPVRFTAPPAGTAKKEHAVDLQGATRLRRVTLELEAAGDGIATGWFNWLGLSNRQFLARYLQQWQRFDAAWEGYLKPASYEPAFTPTYGLFVNSGELAALRGQHQAHLQAHGESPFLTAGRAAGVVPPESLIGEYVNFWWDTRYCREREHGRTILVHGPNAAIAGILMQDKELLRLGARYALAIAQCAHWDDGMICCFPDGNFDHRCFVQSLCCYECSLLLDLCGECFTDLGRELILRRLAEEGLGNINYNTWRYEYIFHCNQLAWFTPGRMLAYLVLERHWKHVGPYIDIARNELLESLENCILADGGYVEGPTYFRCVGRDAGLPLYFLARARGLDFTSTIPETMRRCAAFGEAIISTDSAQDVVPFCDGVAFHDASSQAVMALALPQSAWVRMLRQGPLRAGALPDMRAGGTVPFMADAFLAWVLSQYVPAAVPAPEPFVCLPVMGIMASTRRLGDDAWVKLLLMGNQAGAGHAHEDKGSFVLEFAGDTFAMDSGTCDYSSPFAGLAKNCERHNMLVPYGVAERPHPQCPLPKDVKPVGQGDAVRFSASLNVAPGWEPYYRSWQRTWESPTPDTLTITDDYELVQGDGVEFGWVTRLPVAITGRQVLIRGKRGTVELTAPADCEVRIDELPFFGGVTHHRIVLRRAGRAGRLEVHVKLAL